MWATVTLPHSDWYFRLPCPSPLEVTTFGAFVWLPKVPEQADTRFDNGKLIVYSHQPSELFQLFLFCAVRVKWSWWQRSKKFRMMKYRLDTGFHRHSPLELWSYTLWCMRYYILTAPGNHADSIGTNSSSICTQLDLWSVLSKDVSAAMQFLISCK